MNTLNGLKHSSTPWKAIIESEYFETANIMSKDKIIMSNVEMADAALIVRAVNDRETLLKSAKLLKKLADASRDALQLLHEMGASGGIEDMPAPIYDKLEQTLNEVEELN